jgi:type II secretory pathway pseudopilin PulG
MCAQTPQSRLSLHSEQGSFLVEVLVGAVVLAITTLAVLSGLDGAQDTGRRNKDRSEYAALAQQDIERLRAMPITELSNYRETRTVRVGNVDYTVTSETQWVRDVSGVVSCTDDSSQAEYLKLTSTVTSPADTARTPVKETTLLTPAPGAYSPTTGTAAVRLTDRDGRPLAGRTVSLSGPASFSATTNALGCAVFGYIPAGDYTAQVSGGVTWASDLPATAPLTVNAGRTSLTSIEVEQPASLRAFFRSPSGTATQWSRITVGHAKLPAGFKVFPSTTATTPRSSIDATNLFPHHDAYGVYAGSCDTNNPAYWDSDYFQPGGPGYIELDPGDNLKSVNVITPVLTVVVSKSTSSARRARVTVTPLNDPDCTTKVIDANSGSPDLGSPKSFFIPLPFGEYRLCVDDGLQRKISKDNGPDPRTPQDHALVPGQPLTATDAVDMTNPDALEAGTCP